MTFPIGLRDFFRYNNTGITANIGIYHWFLWHFYDISMILREYLGLSSILRPYKYHRNLRLAVKSMITLDIHVIS